MGPRFRSKKGPDVVCRPSSYAMAVPRCAECNTAVQSTHCPRTESACSTLRGKPPTVRLDQHPTRVNPGTTVERLHPIQPLALPYHAQVRLHPASFSFFSLFRRRFPVHVLVCLLLSVLGTLFLLSVPSTTSAALASAPDVVIPASFAPPRKLKATEDLPQALEELLNVGGGTSLFIGVFLTLIGSVMMAGGSTMMKVGLHLEAEKSRSSASLMCEPMWIAGFSGTLRLARCPSSVSVEIECSTCPRDCIHYMGPADPVLSVPLAGCIS